MNLRRYIPMGCFAALGVLGGCANSNQMGFNALGPVPPVSFAQFAAGITISVMVAGILYAFGHEWSR